MTVSGKSDRVSLVYWLHSINEPLKLASKKQNLNPMNVVAILASGSDSKFDFE